MSISREYTTQSFWDCGRAVRGRRDLGWPSTDRRRHRRPASSPASCRERPDPKPACGSSPKRRTCRRTSSRSSSPTISGRFLLPELPNATYNVWVRGYGLVDSKPQPLKPGADAGDAARRPRRRRRRKPRRSIRATTGCRCWSRRRPASSPAPARRATASARACCRRTTGSTRSSPTATSAISSGNQLTRSVDHVLKAKPELKTHAEAWEWRLGTGVRGNVDVRRAQQPGPDAAR